MTPAVRSIILGSPIDPDVIAWANAVVANGGFVSSGRISRNRATVAALKAGTSWALDDDILCLVAENPAQALTSWKQRRLATAVNSPTFAADAGYTFDGATNYIDTGFIPNTHKVAMAQDNVRLAAYVRNNITSSGYVCGTNASGTRTLRLRPRTSGSTATADVNATPGSFTLPAADSRGFLGASRSTADATTYNAYKNGSVLARTVDPTTFATTGLSAVSLLIGAFNNAGSASTFAAYTVGLVVVGAALAAGQEAAEYSAIQAHMAALGAQA